MPDQDPAEGEVTEILWRKDAVRVERIVSTGQSSPPGFWYDQAEDEFVLLHQGRAELEFRDGGYQELKAGDWLFIPAHVQHRVAMTSQEPACIWYCVFTGCVA